MVNKSKGTLGSTANNATLGKEACQETAPKGTPDAQGRLEVVICDSHGIEDLCINGLIFKVNDIHLLADALQGCLCAQGCQVSAYIPMRVLQTDSAVQEQGQVDLHHF